MCARCLVQLRRHDRDESLRQVANSGYAGRASTQAPALLWEDRRPHSCTERS